MTVQVENELALIERRDDNGGTYTIVGISLRSPDNRAGRAGQRRSRDAANPA